MYKSLIKYSIITMLILLPASFLLSGCNQDEASENNTVSETQTTPETTQEASSSETNEGASETNSEENNSGDANSNEMSDDKAVENKGGNPMLIIKTSKGDIKVELDQENAPISTDNFIAYVQDGFYDGTIFHRVINGFMVQGGGFTTDMQQKSTNAPIKNEAENGLKNERGTLAMARTQDINSATSQFFINLVDNAFLDNGRRDFGYAVFGKVVDGMDVVDAIAAVQTGPGDVPQEQVVIESVTIVE
ncbi:MAG: hypothetical protein DHS20C13_07600 [Thermodesulfobacteriota bacterium]|nr:MAG: hypothetical protein DHS20C13_07600 [Thermodesulfobacteriota bacterium]